jgi:hypothetical protein
MKLKVTVKRRLIIFHKPQQWAEIQARLVADYGEKMTISFVMRRELGFSVRRHRALVPNSPVLEGRIEWSAGMHYEDHIHLDFYSDAAQSWFQLRYL